MSGCRGVRTTVRMRRWGRPRRAGGRSHAGSWPRCTTGRSSRSANSAASSGRWWPRSTSGRAEDRRQPRELVRALGPTGSTSTPFYSVPHAVTRRGVDGRTATATVGIAIGTDGGPSTGNSRVAFRLWCSRVRGGSVTPFTFGGPPLERTRCRNVKIRHGFGAVPTPRSATPRAH